MERCKQCGSDKIIPNVPLLDHYGDLGGKYDQATIQVEGVPQAWIFKDAVTGTLFLMICGECGHAELRVSNAHELWQKYQKSRGEETPR
jgi:hypothetical protein